MRSRRTNQKGFTLIELLIVIAIIGILAAVLIPNLLGARKRAYDTGAESCAKSIQTAEAVSQIDNQDYFNFSKTAGTAGSTTPSVTLSAGSAYTPDGINSACAQKQMGIAITAASTGGYSGTVADTRGNATFNVTPDSLSK